MISTRCSGKVTSLIAGQLKKHCHHCLHRWQIEHTRPGGPSNLQPSMDQGDNKRPNRADDCRSTRGFGIRLRRSSCVRTEEVDDTITWRWTANGCYNATDLATVSTRSHATPGRFVSVWHAPGEDLSLARSQAQALDNGSPKTPQTRSPPIVSPVCSSGGNLR